jgi:hypothetical protein
MSVRVRTALSATAAAGRAASTAHPRPITSVTVTGEKRLPGQVQPVRPTVNQPRRLNLLSCRRPFGDACDWASGGANALLGVMSRFVQDIGRALARGDLRPRASVPMTSGRLAPAGQTTPTAFPFRSIAVEILAATQSTFCRILTAPTASSAEPN